MLYVVVEEVWSVGIEAKLIRASERPLFAGDRKAAEQDARQRTLAYTFRGWELDAVHPYWWGREAGKRENHRFIEKPAASSEA
jgi:hypothetical protein